MSVAVGAMCKCVCGATCCMCVSLLSGVHTDRRARSLEAHTKRKRERGRGEEGLWISQCKYFVLVCACVCLLLLVITMVPSTDRGRVLVGYVVCGCVLCGVYLSLCGSRLWKAK